MATVTAAAPAPSRLDRAGLGWALFEGGRIPYVVMLGVVFMPYFAQTVVGDVVAGQAEVANFAKYAGFAAACTAPLLRSEEHKSELQSLMRISYAVFCFKKKKN